MGEESSTHEQDKKYNILLKKNLKERDHLGDLGINVKLILKWMQECEVDSSGSV
jgi:hypothetical protein